MERSTLKKNSKLKIETKVVSASEKKTSFWTPFSLMIPALLLMFLFTVIPLFIILSDSTEPIKNYDNSFQAVWSDNDWYRAIINSLVYASVTLPISLAISLTVSSALTTVVRKKLQGFWQTVFFIPYVTSAVAVSLTFVQILGQNGIFNTIFGLDVNWLGKNYEDSWAAIFGVMIYGVWHSLAFQIMILSTAMLAVDKRLYDAANIDGAKGSKIFFNVTFPSIEKTVWYLFTIGLIGAVKVFPLALFNNDSGTALDKAPTMLLYVYHYVSNNQQARAGAASISLVIVIIVYNFIVKRLISFIQFSIGYISEKTAENNIKRQVQKGRKTEYQPKQIKRGDK